MRASSWCGAAARPLRDAHGFRYGRLRHPARGPSICMSPDSNGWADGADGARLLEASTQGLRAPSIAWIAFSVTGTGLLSAAVLARGEL